CPRPGRRAAGPRRGPSARSPGALRASAADARTTRELRELGELRPRWTPLPILSSPGREGERAARSGPSQARSASPARTEGARYFFSSISLAPVSADIALGQPA